MIEEEEKLAPLKEIIIDIRDVMEMYPGQEVEFIVRAVSLHEKLVEALKDIEEICMSVPIDGMQEAILQHARAAIAYAEAKGAK